MKLELLLDSLKAVTVQGNTAVEITGIVMDSRKVEPGVLFAALPGRTTEGCRFIPDAIRAGASAILTGEQTDGNEFLSGHPEIAWIHSPDPRKVLAELACRLFNHPSRQMTLVGVTGTNGKTTTTYMLDAINKKSGTSSALIGTTGCRFGNSEMPVAATTPEPHELQKLLRYLADQKIEVVSMEVSSHALVWHRVTGMQFDIAVFTNLTQDHLDYHRSMNDYLQAKLTLFRSLDPAMATSAEFRAIINGDDPYSSAVRAAVPTGCACLTYGMSPETDVRAWNIHTKSSGTEFTLSSPWGTVECTLPMPGHHNISNALAAFSAACALGADPKTAANALSSIPQVPGRMETISMGQPFLVVIDYAHTPDALDNLLKAVQCSTPGRLITVFGCGGDRDRTKRPVMGRAVSMISQITIVTSDNPRTEEPDRIIADILPGLDHSSRIEIIPERHAAIESAIGMAEPGDAVIIAGKGHETYQTIGRINIHFDDREEARKALRKRGYTG